MDQTATHLVIKHLRPWQILLHTRWTTLEEEGRRLLQQRLGHVLKEFAAKHVQEWCASLHSLLRWGPDLASQRAERYAVHFHGGNQWLPKESLSIGLGSPGLNGCMDVSGRSIDWQVFRHKQVGILTAMRELDLDIIVLPGARLPADFKPPEFGMRR